MLICLKKTKAYHKKNHGEKPMKVLFVIYPEIDSLLEKIDTFYQKLKQISMQLVVLRYLRIVHSII